jgi:hypothetical protein
MAARTDKMCEFRFAANPVDLILGSMSKLWPFCHSSNEITDRHRSVAISSMNAITAPPKQQRQKNQATERRQA